MSSAIAGLVERGLVARTPHPEHGRILECRITPAGLALLHEVQQATRDSERYTGGLSPAKQEQLRALLTEMMISLDLFLPASDPDSAARSI